MDCAEIDLTLQAYLDGELDLPSSLEVERHLQACQACSQAYRGYRSLRSAMSAGPLHFEAPAGLRKRVRSSLRRMNRTEAGSSPRWWRRKVLWIPLAAAIAMFAALPFLVRTPVESLLAQEVVAAHVRSLMPGHLTDVLSSDQHTVKPWFNGKLDFSPPVPELAGQGFPLLGGRLDYIGTRPVAALIYQRRKHLINLFVWPSQRSDKSAEAAVTQNGYHATRWTQSGMTYWAVSDVSEADLREFVNQLRKSVY